MKKVLMVLLAIFLISLSGCFSKKEDKPKVEDKQSIYKTGEGKYSVKIEILDLYYITTEVYIDGEKINKTLRDAWFVYSDYYSIIYLLPGQHKLTWVTTYTKEIKDEFTEKVTYQSIKTTGDKNLDINIDKMTVKLKSAINNTEVEVIKE